MSLNMEDVREMIARFRTIDKEKYPLLILLTKDKNKWVEIGVCSGDFYWSIMIQDIMLAFGKKQLKI